MKLHTLRTFFKYGYKQKTTLIGCFMLCGWIFRAELHVLINNLANNPKIIDAVSTLILSYLIAIDTNKKQP
jgi:hypothetical protein